MTRLLCSAKVSNIKKKSLKKVSVHRPLDELGFGFLAFLQLTFYSSNPAGTRHPALKACEIINPDVIIAENSSCALGLVIACLTRAPNILTLFNLTGLFLQPPLVKQRNRRRRLHVPATSSPEAVADSQR